jgi:DnaK suppressor protein
VGKKNKILKKAAKVKSTAKIAGKASKQTSKKVSTPKKPLKQKKSPPKLVAKKNVVVKIVAKGKVVGSSGKNISKKNKTLSKQPQKATKTLKSLSKGSIRTAKKLAIKAPKAVQPAPKPLDPVFAKIRLGLLASRTELFKMVESSQELERNVSELTFSNEIDLASSLEGREMVFQLASRDRNGLKLIDDALFKMAHGTYGICEACAKPIGIKRLQILPLTQFCIECQETMEHTA